MAPQRNPEGTASAPEHPNRAVARRFWEAAAAGDARFLTQDRSRFDLARLGETVDELRSELSEIFTSERGAVIHYRVSARRGLKRIDNELLMILIIEAGRILEATMVPADQRKSNEFWRLE